MIKIIKDLNAFQDRVNEIEADTTLKDVKSTISDIKKVLNSNRDYVAVCAPQIGSNLRLFVIKRAKEENSGDSRYKVFLNPIIVSKKGLHLSRETNLSLGKQQYIIPRSNELHVAYQEFDGRPNSESFVGAYAEVVQQMIEMLDGITLADYGLPIDDDFDEATDAEKIEILNLYMTSLKNNFNMLTDEINSNAELKNLNDTINFMAHMLDGSIKPIDKDGNEVDMNLFDTSSSKKIVAKEESNQ